MSPRTYDEPGLAPARIPADIDRPDRIVGNLTARQVAILAAAGVALWLAYTATAHRIPLPVFALAATPLAAVAIVLALGSREGLSLDRLALAALRQARAPRRLIHAPDGIPAAPGFVAANTAGASGRPPAPLRLPATGITPDGVIDLGADGAAVIAAASTVNFALRTGGEQAGLVAAYARWLNSLTGPVQILVRAYRLDVAPAIAALTEAAPSLPHPALEQAALGHAAFLGELAASRDLLGRQVLLIHREPAGPTLAPGRPRRERPGQRRRAEPRHGPAAARLGGQARRRAADAAHALSAAEITVSVLDGAAATAVLAAACSPGELPPPVGMAGAEEPITGPATQDAGWWSAEPGAAVSTDVDTSWHTGGDSAPAEDLDRGAGAQSGDGFGGLRWTA